MAKNRSNPDQLTLPGVELEDQQKFGFAKPGQTPAKKPRKTNRKTNGEGDHLPPNLAKPVKVRVPDFSDSKRPKTCLEVDFPIVPINALSALEGNAGKPIYQMSKWWARRRSCVFRAMLIAAAMEAPIRKNPDGSPVLDQRGVPVADETEAAKAVWDVYYANHQKAGNFKHLKVLDCFMGGGTTLVEGSRLGFQVAGVDLNPVAWFVTKNELAGTDPEEVKRLFDEIEAEVKPVIQPFYVTDCPRGHKGKWYEIVSPRPVAGEGSGVRAVGDNPLPEDEAATRDKPMPPEFDPLRLPPEQRKKYRYEGPEVIYTFWAKHGPCSKPGCAHRTPVFRSPVIAEKRLGVKYIELKCKHCKTVFDAELGDARMAPGAEQVVLPNEKPFTALSQPFAKRLLEYGQGNKGDKSLRVAELCEMVLDEPGLKCPRCGAFAGQFVRDVLANHRQAVRVSDIDKKHLRIQPPRNRVKHVWCYLLIHPDWLKGSPGVIDGEELGGYPDAPVEATARWYQERLKNLRLVEVRGRIKLSEDTSHLDEDRPEAAAQENEADVGADDASDEDPGAGDRKQYGLPHFIRLADGTRINTRRGTVPKQSHFTCGACGQQQDLRESLQAVGHGAPLAPYAIQGYSPVADREGHIYGGRFFAAPSTGDVERLKAAEREWYERRDGDLRDYWPREEIPHTYMTHHANFALPKQGYTHWWKMFNSRELLCHTTIAASISRITPRASHEVQMACIAAAQQYLQNHADFCHYHITRDGLAVVFANNNFRPRAQPLENNLCTPVGWGNFRACCDGIVAGFEWARQPFERFIATHATGGMKVATNDPVLDNAHLYCCSASDVPTSDSFDFVITDPPFGDNVYYSDLSNFFYVWLRLWLRHEYPDLFEPTRTPSAREALSPRLLPEDEADEHYRVRLLACWLEAHRLLKDGGILAFTFHHSEDAQWAVVLSSLFEAGFILEQTYPIASDEQKGEGGQFGAKGTEYDIIHVCRKRLEEPTPVSWPKMRQWVKAELKRLRRLLESYQARELSEADIRVILRGKALEFYSRHYGQVFTAENEPLSIRDGLLGINQLLDERTGEPGDRPPTVVQPVAYQFLRLFGRRESLARDEVSKSLRGTGIVQRELEQRGWIREQNKVVYRVPIPERFQQARKRPRKEMKTEIDQAHFLIGAAMPASGVNLEEELARDTWMVRRSVEGVLDWYAKTAVEPEIRQAAELARTLLRRSLEENRAKLQEQQGFLFDDLQDDLN